MHLHHPSGFPGGSVVKNLPANTGDSDLVPGPDRSQIPWRREWQPTPVFFPGKSMDRGAWQLQSTRSERVRHHWGHTEVLIRYTVCRCFSRLAFIFFCFFILFTASLAVQKLFSLMWSYFLFLLLLLVLFHFMHNLNNLEKNNFILIKITDF